MSEKKLNLAFLDAITRHQAYLYRASSQNINEILREFNIVSGDMLNQLRDYLDNLSHSELIALSGGKYTTPELRRVRELINGWRDSMRDEAQQGVSASAATLSAYETGYTAALAGEKLAKVITGERLYSKAKNIPMSGGALVDELFSKIADDAKQRVEYAIRSGITNGDTTQQIVQRIKGTKRLNYKDGILNSTRSAIERDVRTIRSHVSNQVVEDTFVQLGYDYLKVVATLDGRTSKVCASKDGEVYHHSDSFSRPPYHPNCRTILVGCDKDGNLIGRRPFVADTRPVSKIPKDDRDGVIGQVNSNTDYSSWFGNQSTSFQKEWLGKNRYELYKNGNYDIDRFVDPQGKMYTLNQLKLLDKQTFEELGL
ncbi:phage head morphogenesis protein [Moellerella wisconsensis]|uniref:minor capsid protein n=1 Tax=Moellerella wisconsensis TaxID=158849 RepID=UPI001F4DB4AA|nr:minor capsid protein [Moellerella wisconsensis]UNH28186.1 phage head morphogenesis protein [Moellerella wisconsensis]